MLSWKVIDVKLSEVEASLTTNTPVYPLTQLTDLDTDEVELSGWTLVVWLNMVVSDSLISCMPDLI